MSSHAITYADFEHLTREDLIRKVIELERDLAELTERQKTSGLFDDFPAQDDVCPDREATLGNQEESLHVRENTAVAECELGAVKAAVVEEARQEDGQPFARDDSDSRSPQKVKHLDVDLREKESKDSPSKEVISEADPSSPPTTDEVYTDKDQEVYTEEGTDHESKSVCGSNRGGGCEKQEAVKSDLGSSDLEAEIQTMRTPTPSRSTAFAVQEPSSRQAEIPPMPGSSGLSPATPVAPGASKNTAVKPALRVAQLNSPAGLASPLLQDFTNAQTPVMPSPAPPCRRESGAALGSAHKLKNLFEQRCHESSERKSPVLDGSATRRVARRTAPPATWQIESGGAQPRVPKPKVSLQDLIRAEEAKVAEAQGVSSVTDLHTTAIPQRSSSSLTSGFGTRPLASTSETSAPRNPPGKVSLHDLLRQEKEDAVEAPDSLQAVPSVLAGGRSWKPTSSSTPAKGHSVSKDNDKPPPPKKTLQELLQQDEALRNVV